MRGQRTEERDRETGRGRENEREGEYTSRFECAYFQPRSSPETGLKRSDGETGGSFRSCEIASKLARQNRKCDGGKTMIDRKGRETEKEKGESRVYK